MPQLLGGLLGIVSLEEVIWLSSLHHGSAMEGRLDQVQAWFPSKDPVWGNLDRLLPKWIQVVLKIPTEKIINNSTTWFRKFCQQKK